MTHDGYSIMEILGSDTMTYAEKILKETQLLPESQQQEVLDFALFLKQKHVDRVMDKLIEEDMEAL